MIRSFYLILIVFILMYNPLFAIQFDSNSHYVARIGNRFISKEQLFRSFELNPAWKINQTKEEAYFTQLDKLITEKLFAQEAENIGALNDSSLSGYLNFIREKELIKELYREEVLSKIQISDKEYNDGYDKLKKQLTFNVIFTKDSLRANDYLYKIKNAAFDKIELVDSNTEFKYTLRGISFGDLIAESENPLYSMKPKEIVGPITIKNGFVIYEMLDIVVDKFRSKMDFAEKKSKIKNIISDRKSTEISAIYIRNLMNPHDLKLNPTVFDRFSKLCFENITETLISKNDYLPTIYVRDIELDKIDKNIKSFSNEVLATYKGGKITVGEFVQKIFNMPSKFRPRMKSPRNLRDAVAVVVRNEFLVKIAVNRGFEKREKVLNEFNVQKDEILAAYYMDKSKSGLIITDAEIMEFKNNSPIYKKYGPQISDDYLPEIIKAEKIKLKYIVSLKNKYPVKVDLEYLFASIENPKDTMKFNPLDFRVKEIFH